MVSASIIMSRIRNPLLPDLQVILNECTAIAPQTSRGARHGRTLEVRNMHTALFDQVVRGQKSHGIIVGAHIVGVEPGYTTIDGAYPSCLTASATAANSVTNVRKLTASRSARQKRTTTRRSVRK